jgi:hypothetical protein
MKRWLFAATLAVATAFPALAAEVGVSISIGEPGFYGRIDIGDYPRPQLIYSQPRYVYRNAGRDPIYLRVKPGHARHWKRYCGQYNACNERVYFVQDQWYNRVYVPRYQERHRHYRNRDNNRGHDRRDDRRDDRRYDRRDDKRDDRRDDRRDD